MRSYATFRDIQHDLKQGTLSCTDLVQHHLSNIKSKAHLNAFISVYEQEALDRAIEVDKKIKQGNAGKLAGLVVSLKDVLSHAEHPLQASSKISPFLIKAFSHCCNWLLYFARLSLSSFAQPSCRLAGSP